MRRNAKARLPEQYWSGETAIQAKKKEGSLSMTLRLPSVRGSNSWGPLSREAADPHGVRALIHTLKRHLPAILIFSSAPRPHVPELGVGQANREAWHFVNLLTVAIPANSMTPVSPDPAPALQAVAPSLLGVGFSHRHDSGSPNTRLDSVGISPVARLNLLDDV